MLCSEWAHCSPGLLRVIVASSVITYSTSRGFSLCCFSTNTVPQYQLKLGHVSCYLNYWPNQHFNKTDNLLFIPLFWKLTSWEVLRKMCIIIQYCIILHTVMVILTHFHIDVYHKAILPTLLIADRSTVMDELVCRQIRTVLRWWCIDCLWMGFKHTTTMPCSLL